jgi:hypothetical protein
MSSIIYTAKPTIASRPDAVAFAAKGISGFTCATLSELSLSGFPTEMDVAYEGYKNNISTFIAATHNHHYYPTTAVGVKLDNLVPECLFKLAPMVFKPVPEITMKDDDIQRFVKKYADHKVEVNKAGKTTFFIFHKPTPKLAFKLDPGHDAKFRNHPDTITPRNIITAVYLDNVVRAFLSTQTYASFSTFEETEVEMEEGGEEKKREAIHPESCRFRDENLEVTVNCPVSEEYAALLHAAEVIRDETIAQEVLTAPSMDAAKELEAAIINATSSAFIHAASASDVVYTAKPSSLPHTYNLGAPKDVPRSPGNLFPYFDRMIYSDRTTLKRIFFRHFTRTLGDTFDEIVNQKATFRKSLDGFVDSSFSVQYQHLFSGIDLALQTQTRLFVLTERGEYLGFCLLGYRYTITMEHMVYSPANYKQMQKAVASVTSHSSALDEIVSKLSTLRIQSTGDPEPVVAADIRGSGDLARVLREREIDQKWYEKEMVDLLGKLRFDQAYRPTTAQDIVSVLESFISNPKEFPPPTLPIFIPARVQLLSDPLFCRLAIFGPEAVSPLNSRGITENIPKRTQTISGDSTLAIPKEKLLPKVILARKPVAVATEDWKEVMKRKAFTQDVNERAQQSRCLVFAKRQAEDVLNVMSRLAHEVEDPYASSGGGKRKERGWDDRGEGPSTKRVMTIDDLF